jgi:hypothetical protein
MLYIRTFCSFFFLLHPPPPPGGGGACPLALGAGGRYEGAFYSSRGCTCTQVGPTSGWSVACQEASLFLAYTVSEPRLVSVMPSAIAWPFAIAHRSCCSRSGCAATDLRLALVSLICSLLETQARDFETFLKMRLLLNFATSKMRCHLQGS